jgi:hypothetical protein
MSTLVSDDRVVTPFDRNEAEGPKLPGTSAFGKGSAMNISQETWPLVHPDAATGVWRVRLKRHACRSDKCRTRSRNFWTTGLLLGDAEHKLQRSLNVGVCRAS